MNRHRIACLFVVALLLWSLASSFVHLPIIPYAYAVTVFQSDFEGADSEWTGTATSGSGTLDLNCASTPYAGSECGEFNFSEGGTHEAYAYKTLAISYDNMTFSAWYRWNTTAEWRKFLKFGDSAGDSICTLMMGYNDWKMFYWDGYATMNQTTESHTVGANCYQNITVVSWMSNVNGYHKLYVNSTLVIDVTGLNNTEEGNIGSVYVGCLYNSGYNNQNCRVDDVLISAGEAEDYPPYWTTCQTNNTLAGNDTRIRTYWNDAYGLSHYYFEHNNTGTYETQTVVAFGGYPEWANHDFALNDTVGAIVRWRCFANDTVDQWSNTTWQTITIISNEVPQYGTVSHNTTEADAPCNFTCQWTDDLGLSGFIFGTNNSGTWQNETWTSLTGTNNMSSRVKTLNDTGALRVEYQFWANDTSGEWNNTGIHYLITGGAQDFYASSGSSSDIQSAVDDCEAAGGGTVHIPSGTYDFSPSPTWDDVDVDLTNLGDNITITGATTSKDADGQVISWLTVLNMSWEATDSEAFFDVQGNASTTITIRFTDIKMIGWRLYDLSSVTIYTGVSFDEVLNWRVDHCCFQDVCGSGIWSGSEMNPYNHIPNCGLADHSVFNNTIGNPGFMGAYDRAPPYGSGNRTLGYGVGARRWACDFWDSEITNVVGQYTNYSIYVEDCYFSKWRHCAAINDGLHLVFRFNIVEYGYGIGSVDAHGSYADESQPYAKGSRCFEVYNNTFNEPDQTSGWGYNPGDQWAINHRGGSGFFTNNTLVDGTYDYHHLLELNNDWGNYDPYAPECRINRTYIWSNTLNGATLIGYNSDSTENVHYFLRAPTVGTDGFDYVPYTYPHPLQGGGGEGENTVSLYQPTHQQSLVMGDIKFNFTATFSLGSIANASLWLNISDTWQRVGWNTTVVEDGVLHTINYTFSSPAVYVWNIQVFNSTTSHFAASNYTLTVLAGYTFTENPSLVAVFVLDMTQRLISPTSLLPSFTWPDFATLLSGFVTAYWVYPVAIIGMVAVGLVVLYYGRATPYDYVRSAPWLLVMAAIGLICVFVYYIVITYILGAFA